MKLISYLFRVYVKSSVHIALGVSALLYISMNSHKLAYERSLYQFSFFGSIIAYNFIKYGLEVKRYIIKSTKVMIPLVVLSIISALMALWALFEFSYNQTVLILILGILIYLYTIPFIPSWSNFRNLSRIKIYIVALVWAGITSLLPLIDESIQSIGLEFLQRFVFVLILMIPFEIRDLNYDDASLKTLAQSFGIKGVKLLGVALVIIWIIISLYLQLLPNIFVLFTGMLLVLALLFSKKESNRLYTEFWVESIPIIYALIYALLLNN